MIGSSYASANRFSALRSNSRSQSRNRNRSRSGSFRRNLNANLGNTRQPRNTEKKKAILIEKDSLDSCVAELNVLSMTCTKIEQDISKLENAEMKEILGGITFAIRGIAKVHEKILASAAAEPAPEPERATFAQIAGLAASQQASAKPQMQGGAAARSSSAQSGNPNKKRKPSSTADGQGNPEIQIVDLDEADRKYYRFKDVIREAEKSTLIFNLNLGKYPIMDPNTMSTRAALALSAMAAKVEKSTTSHPSDEARETIDDVMGIIKNCEFYGKQTKTYRNSKDPLSSAYCTLPVRYDFADRDTRVRAEQILRERCDVNCSTPYPLIVRECMKGAANALRKAFPGATPRVNVDAHNFCLRLAKKEKGAQKYDWLDAVIPLPALALETELKKIPPGFAFEVKIAAAQTTNPETADKIAEPMEGANGPQS